MDTFSFALVRKCLMIVLACTILTNVNSYAQTETTLDTLDLERLRNRLQQIENSIDSSLYPIKIELESVKENNRSITDFSSSLLDYSAYFFTLFVLILGFAGYIASRRFSEVDKIRSELKSTSENYQREFEELLKLKEDFIAEKNSVRKLLFPLLEAQWFFYQGDFQKAIDSYKKAQRIAPHDELVTSKLNKLLIEQGNTEEAIKNLTAALKVQPNNGDYRRRLAQALRREGNYILAEEHLNQVLEERQYAPAFYELGCIKMLQGEMEQARVAFINANSNFIKYDGKPRYWVYVNLAIVQDALGNKSDKIKNSNYAQDLLTARLAKTPNNPQHHLYLGFCFLLASKRNYSKAKDSFEKAINFNAPRSLLKSSLKRLEIIFLGNNSRSSKTLLELFRKYV